MTKVAPTTAFIKAARQNFRMNHRQFEEALGYNSDGRVSVALESGSRNGKPFVLLGTGLAALNYLTAIVQAYDALQSEDYGAAEAILRLALPVKLQ